MSRPHPVLRWIKRITIGLVGLVILSVGGALAALHTDWGREILRSRIEAQLNEVFVGGAKVGKIEGSVFGELLVRDLTLDGPDGKPAIQVGVFHVELALLPLLSHELQLDRVVAEDVEVTALRDAAGHQELADMISDSGPTAWSVILADVQVHRGHVHADAGVEIIDLDGVSLAGSARIPAEGAVSASAVIHASVRQRGGAVVDAALALRSDEELLDVPVALISVGGAGIAVADLRMARGGKFAASGVVAMSGSAAVVSRLVPGVELPADAAVAAIFAPDGDSSGADFSAPPVAIHASLFGRLGASPMRAFVRGDLAARHASGVLLAENVDVGLLSAGQVGGIAEALVAFDATAATSGGAAPTATAIVTAWGTLAGQPPVELVVALAGDASRFHTTIGAATPGALAGLAATMVRRGDTLLLESSRLVAGARDPARLFTAAPPVRGVVRADLAVSGELWPVPALAVRGTADGDDLRFQDLRVAALRLRIDATALPARPLGTAHLELTSVARGPSVLLARLDVDAASRADHSIQVSVRSRPTGWPEIVDVDAIVTPGPTTVVQLTHHHVRAAGVDWAGSTGRFEISPHGLAVAELATASTVGRLALAGRYQPGGTRGHLVVDARGELAGVGTATLALDTDTPAALGDARGWSRLPRAAIRHAELVLHGDVGRLGARVEQSGYAGALDVAVTLTPSDLTGTIDMHSVQAPALRGIGTISGHVALAQHGVTDLGVTADAIVDGLAGIHLQAHGDLPDRLFDLAAWHALGRDAFHGASVKLDELTLGPALFDRFHLVSDLRGRVEVALEIPRGARSATLVLDVHQLRVGPLAQPLDAHLESVIDDHETTASVSVRTPETLLVELRTHVPLTLAGLLADPKRALAAAPLDATATLRAVPARALLATVGRSDVTGGTVDGTLHLMGTLAKPAVTVRVAVHDLALPAGLGARMPQTMHELAVTGSWDGSEGTVTLTSDDTTGGTLRITATGSPEAPAAVTLQLEAHHFELRPIATFAPGVAGGVTGQLDGAVEVIGLDPRTAVVTGNLALTNARIPLAPQIGSLRKANVRISIANQILHVDGEGKLGKDGTVKLVADAPLAEGATAGTVKLTLRKITPIGVVQPVIDSDLSAKLRRADGVWQADVALTNTRVVIPDEKGQALDPVGLPADVHYGPRPVVVAPKDKPGQPAPPPHPLLIATVKLGSTTVDSSDARGVVLGEVRVSVGEAEYGGSRVGVVGEIHADHGQVSLFDRRYQIDRAALTFDGSIDPVVDVRIVYDFPDVSTITDVRGRLSKPELTLSSQPGLYTQGELLGFLLGGQPNGDPSQSQTASSKVTGAGVGYVANTVGGYVKKALPVDVDVLRYESASATNSAAVTVGTWITRAVLLAYRRHLYARPDENQSEANAEYWIRPRLVLQGVLGDRGYDGLDLLWRKRW